MAGKETAPTGGVDDLIALFDSLVPPDSDVVVVDVGGNEYTLPSALPARRQIKVVRTIEGIKTAALDKSTLEPMLAVFSGEVAGTELMGAILSAILALCENDAILDGLERAFTIAHPRVVESAIAAVGPEPDGERPVGAADVFGVEDLIGGLLPFFVRLLKRGAGAIGSIGALQPTPASAVETVETTPPDEPAST